MSNITAAKKESEKKGNGLNKALDWSLSSQVCTALSYTANRKSGIFWIFLNIDVLWL